MNPCIQWHWLGWALADSAQEYSATLLLFKFISNFLYIKASDKRHQNVIKNSFHRLWAKLWNKRIIHFQNPRNLWFLIAWTTGKCPVLNYYHVCNLSYDFVNSIPFIIFPFDLIFCSVIIFDIWAENSIKRRIHFI